MGILGKRKEQTKDEWKQNDKKEIEEEAKNEQEKGWDGVGNK